MEQTPDFLVVSLLAAVSVAVGLTSASYSDEIAGPQSSRGGILASTIADVLGLDQDQVENYLEGHRSEIRYGAASLHST